jgi:probable rRNA maturation factor
MNPDFTTARPPTRRLLRIVFVKRPAARDTPTSGLKRFLRQVATAAGAQADEVTVVLAGDDEVRELNRAYRHQDRTTDILSFPGERLPDGRVHQGEMIISVEKAARQAAQRHHALDTELRYLLIHGFLHLIGLDHETDQGEMEAEEIRLRNLLLTATQGKR